jgi:hypothetical protein
LTAISTSSRARARRAINHASTSRTLDTRMSPETETPIMQAYLQDEITNPKPRDDREGRALVPTVAAYSARLE